MIAMVATAMVAMVVTAAAAAAAVLLPPVMGRIMGAPRNEVKIGHLGDGGNLISDDGFGDGTTPRTCTDFCLRQILLFLKSV